MAPEWVAWHLLVPTQDGVWWRALVDNTRRGPDPFPNVVEWRGTKYLEDGHHRVARALVRGEVGGMARVVRI